MLKNILKLSALLLCTNTFASIDDVALGVGSQTQFVGKVQTNESGSTNKFEFNPYVSASAEYSFTENLSLFPEFGFLIPDSTRDPKISKMTFFVLSMLGYEINDWVLRAGVGLQMTRINSDGGVQVLDNGNGQTSFPMPEGAATGRNVITNLGVEYFVHKDWSARVDSTIYNPFNGRNRAFGYQFAVHFHFHDILGGNKKTKIKQETSNEDTW